MNPGCIHRGVKSRESGKPGQDIFHCDVHGECSINGYPTELACCKRCLNRVETLPLGGNFKGTCEKKPWEYEVTAVIPTINATDRLPYVIELLRLQTCKPFILVIDTGSLPPERDKLNLLRAADVEVHELRLNGVNHSSEVVSIAMDCALALCRTRFMFCTHDDCFLMRQDTLQGFRDLAHRHVAAGHQLPPRPHDDWIKMFGHTALMLDVNWLLDHGITWNMRRGVRFFGFKQVEANSYVFPNWPDTEHSINYQLWRQGIYGYLTGSERNWRRNQDMWIDHCRTAGSAEIYDPEFAAVSSRKWLKEAIRDARERIDTWRAFPVQQVEQLPDPAPVPVLERPNFTLGFFGNDKYEDKDKSPTNP